MKRNTLPIKTIVAVGIGSAVFMILGRFGSIPTGIPNTNIETAYAFLALMSVLYGPLAGFLIGLIGHGLKDIIFYGSPWISWVIASAIMGFIIGVCCKKIKIDEGIFGKKQITVFNIVQIISNIIAWGLVAPGLDILIYAEPSNKVFLQGAIGGVSNTITVGILGTILINNYAKTRTKKGSLDKEY
ncbi:ECF-type riboflavin transporter substrate-binding protein [Clostridium senegalense]|uniref:ECF-type riboflavin transporter substrate-binding protein n=1 Tax=Clostridium senegalense TaxID=1465809 RepID=UPI0002892A7B|nr:ECF-type riboflavin transporter substrate-binding protein [Clostridium senegalense]MBU5225928.1 ECF-type riboflavin transporter substrate-binding protein [Clostridium senegalense]